MARVSQEELQCKALADRTRLRILRLLAEGELCVGDLVWVIQVPQPTASRHLGLLRTAGLVRVRKSGVWVHYSLTPATTTFQRQLLRTIRTLPASIGWIEKDHQRSTEVRKRSNCC